ncbi:MAG: hypothetical protein GY906_13300 [bacterium]|nr:hypothetical protein [bacterium]
MQGGDPREMVEGAIELVQQKKYDEAIGVFEQHLPILGGGDIADKRVAVAAFSYYGLCVAMVRRKHGEATKYCQVSLKSNSYEPEHCYNLAMVHLEFDDRRRAVKMLKKGLQLSPRHKKINRAYQEIGQRKSPVIPFLHRNNPVNVWLGRRRAEVTDD